MQRLAEIDARRKVLLTELEELNREEFLIRQNLAAASMNPTIVAAIQRANSQQGCAEAQALLDSATPDMRASFMSAILSELRPLMSDAYGSLVVQKMLDSCDMPELHTFLDAIATGNVFVDASSTAPGSRILQRMVDMARTPDTAAKYNALICHHVVPLSCNSNSSHIVQRALANKFIEDKSAIVDALTNNLLPISTDKQGCCVLMRAIDWLPEVQRDRIVGSIVTNEVALVQDAYGNYVVQHLLERNEDAIIRKVIQPLLHNIAALACNKFSSNVVEKCVRFAKPTVRQLLIDEITDPAVLPRLVQDSFANYVVQTAISASSEEQFQQLHAAIRPCFAMLKNSPYGVRIDARIQRRLKDNARAKQRKKKQEVNQQGRQAAPQALGNSPSNQPLAMSHQNMLSPHFFNPAAPLPPHQQHGLSQASNSFTSTSTGSHSSPQQPQQLAMPNKAAYNQQHLGLGHSGSPSFNGMTAAAPGSPMNGAGSSSGSPRHGARINPYAPLPLHA